MPEPVECQCCLENATIVNKLHYKLPDDTFVACITEHPAFKSLCLDEWVLEQAYLNYVKMYGHMDDPDENR